jgi:hypothetical protein
MEIEMKEDDFVQKIDMLDQLLNDANVRLEPAKIWSLLAEIVERASPNREGLPQPPAADCPESGKMGGQAMRIPCGLCGNKGVFRGIECPACQAEVIVDPSGSDRGIVHDGKSDLPVCGFGDIEPAPLTSQASIDCARMDRANPQARGA